MINIPIHWFIVIIFLLIFFIGLTIFWFKEYDKENKKAKCYEDYYSKKAKEYDELYKKTNRLVLSLTGQLVSDVTNILVHSEGPDNKQTRIITKDNEYIIDTKITKTKSHVFWSDEDEKI